MLQLAFMADMHVDSPSGPRLGSVVAMLVSVSPPEAVAADAAFLGEEETLDQEAPLLPPSAPLVRLGASQNDGGASMVKRQEAFVGGPRRLDAAGTAAGEVAPLLKTAAWMDAVFTMKGSIHLAEDGRAFVDLVRRLATEPGVPLVFVDSHLDVKAHFALGQLSLPDIILDHELFMDGMGSVDKVEVKDFHLLGEKEGAWFFQARAVLPSRVPATVPLGPLGMRLSFAGLPLGYLAANNVMIREGDNELTFAGILKPKTSRRTAEKLSALFSAAVSGLPNVQRPQIGITLSTDLSGPAFALLQPYLHLLEQEEGEHQQQTPARWVMAAIEDLVLQMPVPSLGDAADRVEGVGMQQLHINWPAASDYTVPLSGISLLRLSNPLGPRVLLRVQNISIDAQVAAVMEAEAPSVPTPGGALVAVGAPNVAEVLVPLGRMQAGLDDLTCTAVGSGSSGLGPVGDFPAVTSDAGVIEISAPINTSLEIPEAPEGSRHFGTFAAAFVEQRTMRLIVKGAADCLIETPFGPVFVSQVTLNNTMEVPGLGGISDISFRDFRVVGIGNVEAFLTNIGETGDTAGAAAAANDGILMKAMVLVESSSEASAELGNVELLISFQGAVVGRMQASSAAIRRGTNPVELQGTSPFIVFLCLCLLLSLYIGLPASLCLCVPFLSLSLSACLSLPPSVSLALSPHGLALCLALSLSSCPSVSAPVSMPVFLYLSLPVPGGGAAFIAQIPVLSLSVSTLFRGFVAQQGQREKSLSSLLLRPCRDPCSPGGVDSQGDPPLGSSRSALAIRGPPSRAFAASVASSICYFPWLRHPSSGGGAAC